MIDENQRVGSVQKPDRDRWRVLEPLLDRALELKNGAFLRQKIAATGGNGNGPDTTTASCCFVGKRIVPRNP